MGSLAIGITEKGDPYYEEDSWFKWIEYGKPCILVTKHLNGILGKHPFLLQQNNIIIHCTITGYGGTIFEPNVPNPQIILKTLENIDDKYKNKVVIRIDPIIPIDQFFKQSKKIFKSCMSLGFKRFRISILDMYFHIWDRLKTIVGGNLIEDFAKVYGNRYKAEACIHAEFNLRQKIIEGFKKEIEGKDEVKLEVCCEPGIESIGCISEADFPILGIKPDMTLVFKHRPRQFCDCLSLKHELLKGGNCKSGCFYCYWKHPLKI
jgi:DNA repair photolyase